MRKLAALEPRAAWPGHAEPLTGDVRAQLERAAPPADGQAQPQPRREARSPPRSRDYQDPEGDVLTLRGALTPATRREYARRSAGSPLSQEDAWQRAVEFLFERLAVRWTIAGEPLEGQKELLARYRVATPAERRWVRDVLREHVAENFPELRRRERGRRRRSSGPGREPVASPSC